jgi:hypothetical protein
MRWRGDGSKLAIHPSHQLDAIADTEFRIDVAKMCPHSVKGKA